MFCGNCGNQINDGAKFCAACGNPIETPVQAKVQAPVQSNTYNSVQQPVNPVGQMNIQQSQGMSNQPYVHQATNNTKSKKSFSPIGTFSFFAWIVLLIFGGQISASAGAKTGNVVLIIFSIIDACICIYDLKCGDEKYSKGLTIASIVFSAFCFVLVAMFGI